MATSAPPTPGLDSGAPSGGGDFAELGELLGQGWDAAVSDEGTPAEGDPGGGDAAPITDPAPADTAETAAQPDQATALQADTAPIDSQYQLTPDGKSYLVPKGQFPTLQAAQKFHQEVGQYFGTPQEAQAAYVQAADHRAMLNDFRTGRPDLIQGFLDHLATGGHGVGPLVQQRHAQAFAAMAQAIPATLAKINPQAAENMWSSMIDSRIKAAYAKAALEQKPTDYDANGLPIEGSPFRKAQEMEYGLKGTYETELPKVNPQAQKLTEAEQRIRDFEVRQKAALNRDLSGFNDQALEGAKFRQLGELIDRTLAKVKDRYPAAAYEDLKEGIHRKLVDKLRSENEFWREHEQDFYAIVDDYKTTWQQGNPGKGLERSVQTYIQNFINRAQRHLPSIAGPRIADATRTQVARANNGQFAASSQPQARPNGTAAPANGKAPRKSSDQVDQEWNALFAPFKQ